MVWVEMESQHYSRKSKGPHQSGLCGIVKMGIVLSKAYVTPEEAILVPRVPVEAAIV